MACDVDVYRAAADRGLLSERKHRPRGFEMTEEVQLLAAIFQLLQQLIGVTARDKKHKPKPWPSPQTAADIVKRQDQEREYNNLMDDIVFVPQAEFDRLLTEHGADGPPFLLGDGNPENAAAEADPTGSG